MQKISELYKIPIILDESFVTVGDIDRIMGHDNFIPNIRISKLGGLPRTLPVVEVTSRNQIPIILGSFVGETSILSRLWLVVASRCDPDLFAAEGAYSTHLLQTDITNTPIIVQPPGTIDVPETVINSAGLGIEISPEIRQFLAPAGK